MAGAGQSTPASAVSQTRRVWAPWKEQVTSHGCTTPLNLEL